LFYQIGPDAPTLVCGAAEAPPSETNMQSKQELKMNLKTHCAPPSMRSA